MGRAPEVMLFVDSPLVSRVHATLAWQGSAWVLTDNQSTNGVFVDARRLTQPVSIDRPTQVRLGDAISGPLLHLLPANPQPPATTFDAPAPRRRHSRLRRSRGRRSRARRRTLSGGRRSSSSVRSTRRPRTRPRPR